jgi:perosamine synthetase
MRTRPRLPYGRQSIDDADVEAASEALRSDFLTTGPRVAAFEDDLRQVTGAAHAAALSSGTAALHAAYAALGIGAGDEVVMPPLTFASTANAALFLGARPVFVDVEPETGTLDPDKVEAAISERTRAIVAVDHAGHPAAYDRLAPLAARHGLPIVADAAHSLGASLDGRQVGTLAELTTLSFHPVKHITTGEGGAVLSADRAVHDRVVLFRSHGMVRDPALMRRSEGPWHQEMHMLGFNYRITDIQCALGSSQLRRLPAFLARRRAIAATYDAALGDLPGLETPQVRPAANPSWHLYVVRVADPTCRRPFFERLLADGLGVQVHYVPVYRHPYYEDLGYPAGLCPVAEDLYARSVSLPIFPGMDDGDVARVVEAVQTAAHDLLA